VRTSYSRNPPHLIRSSTDQATPSCECKKIHCEPPENGFTFPGEVELPSETGRWGIAEGRRRCRSLDLSERKQDAGIICIRLKSPCLITQGELVNKTELIERIATGADLSKAAAGRALETAIEAITQAVAQGDTVTLVGFGSFKPVKRAARTGKNPATGAVLKIAAKTVPKFLAGTTFKDRVAKKK